MAFVCAKRVVKYTVEISWCYQREMECVMGISLWCFYCWIFMYCTGWFAKPTEKKTSVRPPEDMKAAFMAEMKAGNIKQFL